MKVQKAIRLAHTYSVLISIVANSLLVVALVYFITFTDQSEPDLGMVLQIDPVAQEAIEELEREIEPEQVVDPDQIPDITDLRMDMMVNTEFEVETETVQNVNQTEVASLSDLMSDVSSPVVLTGLLVGRTGTARAAAMARYGQGWEKYSEPAVMRALEWLRDHQHVSGGWTKDGALSGRGVNVGYTGLALLAFLAHGETPASAQFGSTVARAIRFLVENQASDGVFQPAGQHLAYGHAMATYALAEAYTMTENILLREPLQRGVEVLIRGQQRDGGYDYLYKKAARNDLSLGAWHVQALKAASISGIDGSGRVQEFLQRAMDGMLLGSRTHDNGRGFTYSLNNGQFTHPATRRVITAAGGLGLYLSGRGRSREARETMQWLSQFTETERQPAWGQAAGGGEYGGEINFWYYAVQAYFQENPDGQNFKRFMPAMVKALVQNQQSDGHWICFTEGGTRQGKTYNTTLAALGLMVYYRYLPTTQAENIRPQGSGPAAAPVRDETEIIFEI